MQLLGKSLKKIFYEYNKKLPLSMLKNIGIQIHNRFIIHGDIKLSCFFIDNYTNFDIYIVDFGFSFDWNKNNESFDDRAYSYGDINFCSKNVLKVIQKNKRDDIESVGNIFIYSLQEFLPWDIFGTDICKL